MKRESRSCDVIIVGGGIMGCAAAYNLKVNDSALKVAVVERDATYACASTTLSVANVRTQFSLKENILVSKYAGKFLETFDEEMAVAGEKPAVNFRREGNLFLISAEQQAAARQSLHLQRSLGCQVEWWSGGDIRRRFPLYEPDSLAGATFGPDDGHLDASAFLWGYRSKARSLGVAFIADEVVRIARDGGGVSGAALASGKTLSAGVVVNCAGAWAARLAKTVGIDLPVVPTKRQVFVLDTAVKPAAPLPLTVLPSGLYFRSDTGGVILLGKSLADDPVGFDFSWDERRFVDHLWPELAAFVPAFDRLKVKHGWAGLYAVNTFDGNAILGEWPECKGLFLANGFSGHGLQQAPAVGRYLAELILGYPHKLDLSIFSPRRILENRPLSENGLV